MCIRDSAYTIPEIWANFGNMHPSGTAIWSFMFITVACGAISGFHSTQSPLIDVYKRQLQSGSVHLDDGANALADGIAQVQAGIDTLNGNSCLLYTSIIRMAAPCSP